MSNKVMIVDDDPSVLLTVRIVLETEGLDITPVGSGRECVEKIKDGFRGLVLLDIMMPNMSGWETVKAIKEQDLISGNVICMLTALESPDEKMDDIKEYVMEYLRKPFDPNELVYNVREYLNYVE